MEDFDFDVLTGPSGPETPRRQAAPKPERKPAEAERPAQERRPPDA